MIRCFAFNPPMAQPSTRLTRPCPRRLGSSRSHYVSSTVHESSLSIECLPLGGRLHFLHFETKDLGDVCRVLQVRFEEADARLFRRRDRGGMRGGTLLLAPHVM